MLRTIATAALAATALLGTTATAHAGQVEPADRHVKHVRVTYVEPLGGKAFYYELNNGAAFKASKAGESRRGLLKMSAKQRRALVPVIARGLKPCEYEDSANCVWHAGSQGNGVGHSFIDRDGRAFYFDGTVSRGEV